MERAIDFFEIIIKKANHIQAEPRLALYLAGKHRARLARAKDRHSLGLRGVSSFGEETVPKNPHNNPQPADPEE